MAKVFARIMLSAIFVLGGFGKITDFENVRVPGVLG